jgi:serine/threonine protein kinase/tetratricopeptide (TPR) repeat protein
MGSSDYSDLSVEPSAIQRLSVEQRDRLTAILDRYLSALESGAPPDREELLKTHPDLAGPLQAYLYSLDQLHDAAAGFGQAAIAGGTSVESASPANEKRLGDFRILREVGRGGMGVVYEAQQISLGRRVALKVLPFAAVLDSKQVARFKNEAQAAAQLHHPNIVAVYAVGVERGVHYYAMQFIDGQPLDRAIAEMRRAAGILPDPAANGSSSSDSSSGAYADSAPTAAGQSTCHSYLAARSQDRSEYFCTVMRMGIQAAEALQAAHEYGIVHRDVKPSNLILAGDGNLWVTDFGLARCQSEASLTRTGDVVGTTRYMSPEQARGQTALVDHRTDIYSLGATLYELLVLQAAFPGDDSPALLRQIDQEEPQRLRRLQPKIPVDLETVIQKAMAKRREERYATAQEFADDLRRVLEGKPTIAKPPTLPDRVAKWARRHRRIVAAVVAVGTCAVLGMAVSTLLIAREKVKADLSFQRAERNFREAREAVDRFGTRLAETLADVPGAAQVRRELLEDTLRYYRDFAVQARHDPSLRADLATTYSKIGTLNGELGSSDGAIEAHRNALRLSEQLAAEHPRQSDYRARVAVCRSNLALALRTAGRTDEASRVCREAIELQQQIAAEPSSGDRYLSDLGLSYNNLGLLQSDTGQAAKSELAFREAIRLQEHLLASQPEQPDHLRNLAVSLNNLSKLYVVDDPARAAELYERALGYQTRAAQARPGELRYQSDVALTYNNLGVVQSRGKQYAEAAASYGKAIEIRRGLVRKAPSQTSYQSDLAVSYNNLGLAQTRLGRESDAELSFLKALELLEVLVGQSPGDVVLQSSLGGIYNNLARVQEELDRPADALASCRKAVEHQKAAVAAAPNVSQYREFLGKHYSNYGRILRESGRPDEAARAALARRELWPDDAKHLVSVAEELSLASKALASSHIAGLTAQQCAEYALETLRRAVAAGFQPTPDFYRNASFAALKNYPGFMGLVKH